MKVWLFSYGSNSPAQLAERLGHAVKGEGAYAPGHMRVFRGMSRTWGGGTASLKKGTGRPAYGWITKVSEDDLEVLDRFEGVPRVYKRERVKVTTAGGKEVEAIAYVHTSREFGEPTQEYLKAVARTLNAFWSQGGRKVRISDIAVENPVEGPGRPTISLEIKEHRDLGPMPEDNMELFGQWHEREGVPFPEIPITLASSRREWLDQGREERVSWVKRRLAKVGLTLGRSLGAGGFGSVYEVRTLQGEPTGLVAKITMDANEVAVAHRLLQSGIQSPAIPLIAGAWGGLPDGHWLILREDVRKTCRDRPTRALCQALDMDWYRGPPRPAPTAWIGPGPSPTSPLDRLDPQEKTMVKRFRKELQRILTEAGVKFLDLGKDNVRIREDEDGRQDLVVVDFGVATGPATRVPVAMNPAECIETYAKLYEGFDAAHGPSHREQVRAFARLLAEKYAPDKINLVDTAALLHDIGLCRGREHHEAAGADILAADKNLRHCFSEEELGELLHAVREHRASSGKPQTVIAKIISDADRVAHQGETSPMRRAYEYGKHYYPELTEDQQVIRAARVLAERYAPGGTSRRVYFPETLEALDRVYMPVVEAFEAGDIEALRRMVYKGKANPRRRRV